MPIEPVLLLVRGASLTDLTGERRALSGTSPQRPTLLPRVAAGVGIILLVLGLAEVVADLDDRAPARDLEQPERERSDRCLIGRTAPVCQRR